MRSTSLAFRQLIFAQRTDEVPLFLLTINHPDMEGNPIRVVNNMQAVESRGNIFIPWPFEINLPSEKLEELTKVTLRIDNIDRQIVQAIRTISSPPEIILELTLASTPDTVEAGPFSLTLRHVRYDSLVVEGELAYEDILNEPFPGDSYTPAYFPALF